MTAEEFFESQSATDANGKVIDKFAHKYSRFDLIKFAQAYHYSANRTKNAWHTRMIIDRITYIDKEEKELNEVVMKDVDMVHIERMDDGHIWIALYSGEERIVVNYYTKRNGKILGSAERNA